MREFLLSLLDITESLFLDYEIDIDVYEIQRDNIYQSLENLELKGE